MDSVQAVNEGLQRRNAVAHILIAGLGDLGWPLAVHWRDAGHRVSGIRRRNEGPEGVDLYTGDLNEGAVLLPPDRVDLVYIILTPGERSEQGYSRAFLGAPQRLLDQLGQQQPLPPVVFVSSTAVYGDDEAEVDEDTPPSPQRYNGRILLAAEEEISIRSLATVVRFSGIYGPDSQRLVRQAEAIHDGEDPPALRWSNRIHRTDCVRLLTRLGEDWLAGEMQPSLVVGTDGHPVLNYEVLNWLGDQLGRPLELPLNGPPAGKRVRSRYIEESDFELRYPDYRAGYSALLSNRGKEQEARGKG